MKRGMFAMAEQQKSRLLVLTISQRSLTGDATQ